jgi:class 3 adenylate cyclase
MGVAAAATAAAGDLDARGVDMAPRAAGGPRAPDAPTSERRLVSVLFADLVGFTTISEGLDPEDSRELLSDYFEASREIVERYGGTIEKFIGDAVMAVWGTPTAHEDDAERAVRAALDLAAMTPGLGSARRPGATSALQLRAAVLTGEAAVTLGADGQGMVAGDLVNTASRLQSIADAGAVLVGESTYRAASGAIAFEELGDRPVKGRTAPVPAWRAVAVVAKVRGAGRSELIEPPFVGREAEFSALKDRLHATSRDGRARLVSIVGVAGIGKSRLAWEFEKYLDGVVETVYWHHGRSPAYGEGLAFWALGEMVRRRAGIAERDDQATSSQKLGACLDDFVPDQEDQRWIGPRLRALLGLEEAPPGPRDELFAAWRTFFERVAARGTAVLVFEDLQWADPGLVDFIESMMEWSRGHRLLILTLARPELLERRPTWGAGQRDFLSIHLESLPTDAMTALVSGLVPGLPARLVTRIVDRSEGVPLYAVEMVRMLVDRGDLVAGPDGFRTARDLPDLDVPTTLQALIAARLDALPPADRRVLQDAAVLGKTFTADALEAITGESTLALEPTLRNLARRELISIDADPRSPERGHYGFVGALIREVAYGTLARRDRRERHLAAARYFEALGDEELAGLLASHYTDAYAASHEGPEAEAVAAQARIALRAAAERALSLGSSAQAITYLDLAFRVTSDPAEVAHLHEELARAAQFAGDYDRAEAAAREAVAHYHALDEPAGGARGSILLGQVLLYKSRIAEAIDVAQASLSGLDESANASLVVDLKRLLARAEMFSARPTEALAWCEEGLTSAARIDRIEAIADLMVTRAWALGSLSRNRESIAELQGAIGLAHEHGMTRVELRGINNLATFLSTYEPARAVSILREGLALAERIGNADDRDKLSFGGLVALWSGDWAWGGQIIHARLRDDLPTLAWMPLATGRAILLTWRGDALGAEAVLEEIRRRAGEGETYQDAFAVHTAEFHIRLAAGDLAAARSAADDLTIDGEAGGDPFPGVAYAGLVAAWLGDLDGTRRSVERLARGSARMEALEAWQLLLTAAIAAREDRVAESAAHYRWAIEALVHAGNELEAAFAAVEAGAALGQADPYGAIAAEHVRAFAERVGAPSFIELLERQSAAERARPRLSDRAVPSGAAQARSTAQAGTPQNTRTTS